MKSKNPIPRPNVSAHSDIEEVRRRLQAWRQTRQHGERIPEDLWISAAKLARVHRPGTVAHALSLDYDALKERIESVNHLPLRRKEPTSVSFVEVVPPGPAHFSECTVEIEDRDGTKVRVHLKSSEAPDLAAISSALLRRRI
jgi:hypothetical protein